MSHNGTFAQAEHCITDRIITETYERLWQNHIIYFCRMFQNVRFEIIFKRFFRNKKTFLYGDHFRLSYVCLLVCP